MVKCISNDIFVLEICKIKHFYVICVYKLKTIPKMKERVPINLKCYVLTPKTLFVA